MNDDLVMTYEDDEYKKCYFAIQCHNEGMMIEAKDLYYKDLSKAKLINIHKIQTCQVLKT